MWSLVFDVPRLCVMRHSIPEAAFQSGKKAYFRVKACFVAACDAKAKALAFLEATTKASWIGFLVCQFLVCQIKTVSGGMGYVPHSSQDAR